MISLFKKKKKTELSLQELNMNRLWDIWASGELERSNYEIYVLCDYEAGVNGEGHSGFFFNNEEHLLDYHDVLLRLLPPDLKANFEQAFQAYGTDTEEETCEIADSAFFANEQELKEILQEYANRLRG